MWVRGLKHKFSICNLYVGNVAPYVGAWIETVVGGLFGLAGSVAPYVGAWIETVVGILAQKSCGVAPYVGAWIET